MKYTAILYTGLPYEEGQVVIYEVNAKDPAQAEKKAIAECKEGRLSDQIVTCRAIYEGRLTNLRA